MDVTCGWAIEFGDADGAIRIMQKRKKKPNRYRMLSVNRGWKLVPTFR